MNFWLSSSAEQHQNPCSGSPPVYQYLSLHHNWPVNKAIVNMPVRLNGNLKLILDKLILKSVGGQELANKDTLLIWYWCCFTDITNRGHMLFAHMRFCDCDLREAI